MIKSRIKSLLSRFGLGRTRAGEIPVNARQLTAIIYIARMYEHIRGIDGAIVECGVGLGRSFLYLNFLAERDAKPRTVWGFDSFEGFPEPTAFDASERNPKKGDWAGTSEAYIHTVLKAGGISAAWRNDHVRLEKGYFNTSLGRYDKKPIALLHLDGDLYESYKDPLEQLYDLVVPGGLVLFDEYDDEKWPGAKRAVDEFFEKRSEKPLRDTFSGKHYLIKP